MSIGQWFSFQGRIRRKTWWLGYVLVSIAISVLGTVLDISFGFISLEDASPADGYAYQTQGVGPFSLLALIPLIWGGLAGQVKRWHDRDKSGWFVLINFIPLVGAIWSFIELGFLRGTPGPNRFGPDPLGGAGAAQWPQGQPPQQAWQQPPQQWQQPGPYQQPQQQPPQPQWQPPPQQGWQAPPQQGWQGQPPQGYPPQQNPGAPPPGYGQQPPPGYGQQPPPGYGHPPQQPGQWPNPGGPPVRRD
ncbi:DUF805 domain-containing protein [Roseomonas terrae]|uniref:DUF805 domain-containing protein n=1 Tax=Neoroseomonas terrae TaxID=424799 RepID=A0ABS5EFG1_9PROT|nr:DUF805 domain-containing protein [Neoroseomonas terrae]MBR0649753.1 DUF805 domain-containing protein [Neoroseomonas terrae]